MPQRWLWWLLWLFLGLYAFLLAPADDPAVTLELIQHLSAGEVAGINPYVVAEFYAMGLLPLAYACFLAGDGQGQKVPAWPFVIGMMAIGAFSLLPYMGLRRPIAARSSSGSRSGSFLDQFWASVWTGRGLLLALLAVLTWGITQGDWHSFVDLWQHNRFIHVMTLDFCLLSGLMAYWVLEDKSGRDLSPALPNDWWQWLPLVGGLLYLSVRPPFSPSAKK